jgi:signal peptidase I
MNFSEPFGNDSEQPQISATSEAVVPEAVVSEAPPQSAAGVQESPEVAQADAAHNDVAQNQEAVRPVAAEDRPPVGQGFQAFVSTIVVALFVITFTLQAFQIPSESMEKTLLIGDYLLVDKIHFGQGGMWSKILPYRNIRRGDIIVFHYPVDPNQHFVKRVIGLPGDRIHLTDTTVYVNGVAQDESYVVHTYRNIDPYRDNFPDSSGYYSSDVNPQWHSVMPEYLKGGDLVVPQGEYFVLGDNRDRSLDSRYWGFVPRQNIVGRPLVIYLSLREQPDSETRRGASQVLTHIWQFARWNRMFHLVR